MWTFFYETPLTLALSLLAIVVVLVSQAKLNSAYGRFSKERSSRGYKGYEVARMILDRNNLYDVHVVETAGRLSDHYDPKQKVVRLSSDIYHGTSIASISVAAHEVGHAIQDKEGYAFMRFRHALVVPVNLTSNLGWFVVMIGMFAGMSSALIYTGIFLLLGTVVFQLVTLPVEFDASSRALKQLQNAFIIDQEENRYVKKMLGAAALTYVAALASTILELVRLFLMAQRNDD